VTDANQLREKSVKDKEKYQELEITDAMLDLLTSVPHKTSKSIVKLIPFREATRFGYKLTNLQS
jgi:hypothetical protein